MGSFSKFRLRWNNHLSNFVGSLGSLLKSEHYSDVTVYCEGQVWQLHRLILSASSSHFNQLLNSIPIGLTPGIILDGPSAGDMEAIIQFIYHGEVSIHQDLLPSLLRTASSLKIKGLADVSLVDTESQVEDQMISLNYNQCSPAKEERMCHVRQENPQKPVTTLSEICELSPLNLSRHQSSIQNKMESRLDEQVHKGGHKRFAYFDSDDYSIENFYDRPHTHHHGTDSVLVSPPLKKLRSTRMPQPSRDILPCQIDPHNKALSDAEEIPYDLSTNNCCEKKPESNSAICNNLEIKEENGALREEISVDLKNQNKILHISTSHLTPQTIDRHPYLIKKQPEVVHLVREDSPSIDSSSIKAVPEFKTESGNYVHLKKRITNLEKQNCCSIKSNVEDVVKNLEVNSFPNSESSLCPTYSDASVGPSDEVTETFSHKKFSHCTILSSGDAIHVVRGVYNPNLMNGSSYKILNAKSKSTGENYHDNPSGKKSPQASLPTATLSSASAPITGILPVKQETSNVANNSSIMLISPTSQNISSPVNSDMPSPGSKSDDKSAGEGSDNDSYAENGNAQATSGGSDGTGQGSQRVTINMRTFKEEWRRQLLVDYDSRTNMSICMLCFTTFKSYDGPRKNTYVKHAKRFHPALDEYSDEEREVIINMYEKYHKYDIDMQKEINKSFRTPNGPGCVSKRSGKIIDASSLLNCTQNVTKLAQKEVSTVNCDWPDKFCHKSVAESETDETNGSKDVKDNLTIKSELNSKAEVQFSNVSASNFKPEQNICSGGEENTAQVARRKSG